MTTPPVVPFTPIYRRYLEIKATTTHFDRLSAAKQLLADPSLIADEFAQSVTMMAERYRHKASFRPQLKYPPPPRRGVDTVGVDRDLAWFLHRQGTLLVADDPELSADYVNYQLSIISTRGRAVFDDRKRSPAGRALLMDLLLGAADGTPIACEVKLRRDEPFSGLIQLLAYLAHLATPSQYERLCKHHPSARFKAAEMPRLDGYLLLHEFGATPATYLPDLLDCAMQLSAALMSTPAVASHVRRLVCLDATLDLSPAASEPGSLSALTRWRHDAVD